VKERPILFSAPMVRAILEGRKTQTRRTVKPQPAFDPHREQWSWENKAGHIAWSGTRPQAAALLGAREICPYGQPGDRLWVRETWGLARPLRDSEGVVDDELEWSGSIPKADPRGKRLMDDWCVGYAADGCEGRMRPSIHMPRWASRLTLEVTGVRVERLQDISEEDALAEGVGALSYGGAEDIWLGDGEDTRDPRVAFRWLWDSINGGRPWRCWDDNPWVWVVEFRRVEQDDKRGAA